MHQAPAAALGSLLVRVPGRGGRQQVSLRLERQQAAGRRRGGGGGRQAGEGQGAFWGRKAAATGQRSCSFRHPRNFPASGLWGEPVKKTQLEKSGATSPLSWGVNYFLSRCSSTGSVLTVCCPPRIAKCKWVWQGRHRPACPEHENTGKSWCGGKLVFPILGSGPIPTPTPR